MEYPVYVLDLIDHVPIPDTHYILAHDTAHSKKLNFTDHMSEDNDTYIAIAIPRDRDEIDSSDLQVNPQVFINHTYPVGLICKILEYEDSDADFAVVTLEVLMRAELHSDVVYDNLTETLFASATYVPNNPKTFSETVKGDINRVGKIISKNSGHFTPTLAEIIHQNVTAIEKMNMMADEVLSEFKERALYVNAVNEIEQWDLVTQGIGRKLRKKKPKAEPKEQKPETYEDKLKKLDVPDSIRAKISEEINRLDIIPKQSLEYALGQDYLRHVFSLPWGQHTHTDVDLRLLKEALNESHYGLNDVKNYLLEHICLEQVTGKPGGAVMCFIGPPSTGKTSIAKALAKASNRKFGRMALGGVSDEAELRGHRRTYSGSRPGRLMNLIKEAGAQDALILLDECDKISDSRNPATQALLEILDPEQNSEFVDRYFELPFDLSKVLFICTANYEQQIPPALLSRMELIYFRDYTKEERTVILDNYILPKVIEEYKIKEHGITIDPEVLKGLVEEPQLRQIEKRIRRYLRKALLKVRMDGLTELVVTNEFCFQNTTPTPKRAEVGFR